MNDTDRARNVSDDAPGNVIQRHQTIGGSIDRSVGTGSVINVLIDIGAAEL